MTRALPVVGLACLALAVVGEGLSTARPVSPPDGAVVRSAHPILRWELAPQEKSAGITIASRPDTTPQGRFFTENVVTSDYFLSTEDPREWAPASPLYAGRYWWAVESEDRDCCQTYFSPPSSFTIPVDLRIAVVRIRRDVLFSLRSLELEVRWRSNVEETVVSARVATRAGRTLWRASDRESASVGSLETTSFDWLKPRRIKTGARLRVTVTLTAAGVRRALSRAARAP